MISFKNLVQLVWVAAVMAVVVVGFLGGFDN